MNLDDVLGHLVARTNVPSNFGAQIERMRDGIQHVTSTGDPDAAIWKLAPTLRLLQALEAQPVITLPGIKLTALTRLARATGLNQGSLVVGCLRAYQEWSTRSTERALVSVYNWARAKAPDVYRVILHDEATADQAFRVGKAKKARSAALDLYSDSYLVLKAWIDAHARKRDR